MSSSLLYLTPKDFVIKQSEKGYSLTHRINGVSMVLFYSKTCHFCDNLIPMYKTLPGKVQGIHFAMANVSADEKRLEKMAEATVTPIRYVPYIVFYINGEYYMEYRGPKTVDSLARAAYEISTRAISGKDFSTGKICTSTSTGLAGYCVGDDNWEEDVCMTYGEIYNQGSGKVTKQSACMTYGECYNVTSQTPSNPPQPYGMHMGQSMGPQQMMQNQPSIQTPNPSFQRRH